MGSGHILVYAFDVFMQLYEAEGESSRRAAELILENNLYGLDIDKRAFQLAYFALMMKGREYSRRILNQGVRPNVYDIPDNFGITEDDLVLLPLDFANVEKGTEDLKQLIQKFKNGNDLGSLIQFEEIDFENLETVYQKSNEQQLTFDEHAIHDMIQVAKLLQQSFEIVVTNPPYMGGGGFNPTLSSFAKKAYPNSKSDLFAMFIERWIEGTKSSGYIAMITMESWMFLSSYQKLREYLYSRKHIETFIHMPYEGRGRTSLGINFGTSAFVFKKIEIKNAFKGQYYCLQFNQINNEGVPFEYPIKNTRNSVISEVNFSKIPGMPISYWVSENLASLYDYGIISEKYVAKEGVGTRNDAVFLRNFWEVANTNIGRNKRWILTDKAGMYRKWYLGQEFVMDWEDDGYRIRNYRNLDGSLKSRPQNTQYLFKEGVSWGKVGSGASSFRYRFPNKGFNDAAPTLFGDNLYITLASLNSVVTQSALDIKGGTLNITGGIVEGLPLLGFNLGDTTVLIEELSKENIELSISDWNEFETSIDFIAHPFIKYCKEQSIFKMQERFNIWSNIADTRFNRLKENEEEINSIFIEIYGMKDELSPIVKETTVSVHKSDKLRDIKSFISYSVGCIFGRYSLDKDGLIFAGGEWKDMNYESFQPDKNNILLVSEDKYFEDNSIDIVNRFIEFVGVSLGEDNLEENLQFIAEALGGKGTSREVIRTYFVKDFYKDHLQTYKKRPIYWQFDSGRNDGFKALIYLHRYSTETLSSMRVDYLHQLQKTYENAIEQLEHQIQHSLSGADKNMYTKQLQKIRKQYEETMDYDAKLGHLANLQISLDLDDGVIVNYDKLQTDENGNNLKVLSKRT